MIVRSPEGIGKTTALLDELALEILDAAAARYPDGKEQFACLACRSIEQAEAKATEYRNSEPYRSCEFGCELLGTLPPWPTLAVASCPRLTLGAPSQMSALCQKRKCHVLKNQVARAHARAAQPWSRP
jgi:hypothetical protein